MKFIVFSNWFQDSFSTISDELGRFGEKLVEKSVDLKKGMSDFFSDFSSSIEYKKRPGKLFPIGPRIVETERVGDSEGSSSNLERFDTDNHGNKKDPIMVDENKNGSNFNEFIRKMVEIREILKTAQVENGVDLPNIVVIGSQSSGKSSVLENIVGHEFLPKGQNMVTRRPLELTLVHSSENEPDYAIIPQYHPTDRIYDFAKVQSILKEFNLSVPSDEWISSRPIDIKIFSRNVPDLQLVDLPGYIQITNRNQPPILRDKIRELCDSYIKKNNIILAVCPADVDLANAESIKASRKYDPLGERTIGVITKLDLVDPNYAVSLMTNEDYPLMMGYVGVVCRPTLDSASDSLTKTRSFLTSAVGSGPVRTADDFEAEYFKRNHNHFAPLQNRFGFGSLRAILTGSLEETMSRSLVSIISSVEDEIAELRYQLKVQYNDRFVSPEGYISELVSALKHSFNQLTHQFSRSKVKESLRKAFNNQFLYLSNEYFWSDLKINQAANTWDGKTFEYWSNRLHVCIANFTRSGIGRSTANLVANSILEQVEQVFEQHPFMYHRNLQAKLTSAAEYFLKKKCYSAIDQVENSMKPFKYGIEFTPKEWQESREKLLQLLLKEESSMIQRINSLKKELGTKRLRKAIEYLSHQSGQVQLKTTTTSPLGSNSVLTKASEIVELSRRLKNLQNRLSVLCDPKVAQPRSIDDMKRSSSILVKIPFWRSPASLYNSNFLEYEKNDNDEESLVIFKDPCQIYCPEVYLYLVMERFLTTCSTFVHYELVSEFIQPFPDEVISSSSSSPSAFQVENDTNSKISKSATGILSLSKMSKTELFELIKENPNIAHHLNVQERYKALERVYDKLNTLRRQKKQGKYDCESIL